ncbi:zinc-finger doubledomain-containing protein [Cordyceps javanica]|uniref:Zinc-finger doubledomain-containing protein n=1 Tax=Cordyceps javanica TaxID=43265 RepID=A0A545UL84_9HYPO|nr:zinc-finger doubledomain-containing protein [Cordyceps javanica]TQW01663.1 zinc-finger double domain-containing protein [Cordyceps javanica]
MQPFYGSNPPTPPTETPQTPNSAHDLPNYYQSTQASVRSYMQMTGAAMAALAILLGILPSAPGRPTAPAAGTPAAKNMRIPAQDTDGKFPCPYCAKTYLRAKHLKRHILRHTGDRPYTCDLCKDDFSRSDVLKRHSLKCSGRRGNSTGASHLSNFPPTSRNMHGNQPQLSSSSSMGLVASPANGDRRGSQLNGGIVNSTNGQNMHD